MRPVEPVEENHMAVPAALSLHRGLLAAAERERWFSPDGDDRLPGRKGERRGDAGRGAQNHDIAGVTAPGAVDAMVSWL